MPWSTSNICKSKDKGQIPNKSKLVFHRKGAKYAKIKNSNNTLFILTSNLFLCFSGYYIFIRFSLRSLRLCGELSVVFFHSFQEFGVDIRNAVEHPVP